MLNQFKLLEKKCLLPNQAQTRDQFYLWKILAEGLLVRLKMLNLSVHKVALIGPALQSVADYLLQQDADTSITYLESFFVEQSEAYDLIIMNGLLPWFDAPGALIEAIYSSLTKRGLYLFSCLGPETLFSLRKPVSKMNWQMRHEAFVDMHHWGDCLLQTGFLDPVMDRQDINITFTHVQQWFDDWRQQGIDDPSEKSFEGLLTPRKWQQFMALCEQQQPWLATFECLYGHAIKPEKSKQKNANEFSIEDLKQTLPSQNR